MFFLETGNIGEINSCNALHWIYGLLKRCATAECLYLPVEIKNCPSLTWRFLAAPQGFLKDFHRDQQRVYTRPMMRFLYFLALNAVALLIKSVSWWEVVKQWGWYITWRVWNCSVHKLVHSWWASNDNIAAANSYWSFRYVLMEPLPSN